MGIFSLHSAIEHLKKRVKLDARIDFTSKYDWNRKDSNYHDLVIDRNGQTITLDRSGFRPRRINCVVLDETMIGDCIVGGRFDTQKLINKYINPFKRKNIALIAVLGSEEPRTWNDCFTEREYLKLKKNILKAYNNQPDDIKKFEIMMLMEEKRYCFQDITKENIMEECAYYHWLGHNTNKRITKGLKKVAENILKSNGIPVVVSRGEADQWCATIQRYGPADFVLSNDSDMIGMGCDVIVDIDEVNDEIQVIYHSDVMDYYQKRGYTRIQIDQAMALSSADFNFVIYDKELSFPTALKLIKTYGDIFRAMEYLCRKHGRVYDPPIIKAIEQCYDLSNEDIDQILSLLDRQLGHRDRMMIGYQPRSKTNKLVCEDKDRLIRSIYQGYLDIPLSMKDKMFFEFHYQLLQSM